MHNTLAAARKSEGRIPGPKKINKGADGAWGGQKLGENGVGNVVC